jgi:MEMO1 family protein
MTVSTSVLMCHAPIVIPAIAGDRAGECAATTRAMGEAARVLVAAAPDVVCLISPHAPRRPGSVGIVLAPRLSGSFARFGHPDVAVSVPGAPSLATALVSACGALGLTHHTLPDHELDHGALVPLHFLDAAGYRGPVLLVALPYPDEARERALGEAIAEAAEASGLGVAVLASGDMSHRLKEGAPSGYHPRAQQFDTAFVSALRAGDVPAALAIDPMLSELAAEDVLASTRVALAATRGRTGGTRVLAYEGPFGVGYCEAVLCEAPAKSAEAARAEHAGALLHIARRAVRAAAQGRDFVPPPSSAPPRAVFVTLRSPDGELRGCIGRTSPAFEHVTEEVADCAALAATRDPRMEPVAESELEDLRIDVTLLDPPEWDVPKGALDPRRYGVVVKSGARQGVLLPDLEGVDSVDGQLAIALRKAGIAPTESHRIARFTVQKFSE